MSAGQNAAASQASGTGSAGARPPLVSVVLTTYRDDWEKLERAIRSILAQTITDLEFIIVFEGEDANIERVEQTFDDRRLVVDRQPQGIGRSRCHNAGLALTRGRYIARMDGDDYCYPERLAIELEFLEKNPDVAVVGAGGRLMDENDNIIGQRMFPESHDEIIRRMAFVNPILHPTVLWDRQRVGENIRYAHYHVDDLELWLQLLERGKRFANLPVTLIDYEQPPTRPMKSWRGVLWIRLLHWKLGFRYPRYFAGIALFSVLSLLPSVAIDTITRGNRHVDRVRSINRGVPG